MSPASMLKPKLKDNSSVRAAKEQHNSLSKHCGSISTGISSPLNAYKPVSGTIHSFDTDETDEHSVSSLGTAAEYDSQSNNGSCSGESEDHKEKAASNAPKQETIPGCDNEKREKIRQKNEKKHQRQREKRAHELHKQCCGFLMSKKLEALSQQLVAMGFSTERSRLALILNEGRLEESINWLFEGNEEEAQKDVKDEKNLKLDISEELSQIAAMEVRYKCSKQEVERAVVAFEGDLVKAEEVLKSVKQEPAVTPAKPEETSNLKKPLKPQDMPMAATISEPLKANPPESLTERRWLSNGSSSSMSYSSVPPIQVVPSSAKMVGQLNGGGNEDKGIPQVVHAEPILMIQRPQAMNVKQTCAPNNISGSPPGTAEWYARNIMGLNSMKLNDMPLLQKSPAGTTLDGGSCSLKHLYPQAQSTNRSLYADNSRQYYPQAQYTQTQQQSFPTSSSDSVARMGNSWSPSRQVASSLGLFSGWGSTASSGSHMDWNTRDMMSMCDYNSIDWSLEVNSKASGLTEVGNGSVRTLGSNGVRYGGWQNRGMPSDGVISAGGGPMEWTSPFTENDIFSLPRQFVTSPSP